MTIARIALANLRIPTGPHDSVDLATAAIAEAAHSSAELICFPECFIPGYRWPGQPYPPPDPDFLQAAWTRVASSARDAAISVIVGTERLTSRGLLISALVLNSDGSIAGWQDKEQMDPFEESTYVAGVGPLRLPVPILQLRHLNLP